jgi:hypothetical protein
MMRSEVGNGGGAMGHGFDDSPWAAMIRVAGARGC